MSILIISMTRDLMMVASDSKVVGAGITDGQFPKIYQYTPTLAMYGVGNAYISRGYFLLLDDIRRDIGSNFSYENAVDTAEQWKQYIEDDPERKGISGLIGVCGFNHGEPEATTILVDSIDYLSCHHTTKPNGNLTFCIYPPSDVPESVCNGVFKSNSRYTQAPYYRSDLLYISTKTISDICSLSKVIDNTIQYWSYDLRDHTQESRLLDLPYPK